jgi:hypothetical protein
MSRDLVPREPPGEDQLDIPELLCSLVAACSRLRRAVLAVGEALGLTRAKHRVCGA